MITEFKEVLPHEKAIAIRELFLKADYDNITQSRRYKFSHERDPNFLATPDEDEIYTANFCRSKFLEESKEIKEIYNLYIKGMVESIAQRKFQKHDLRCYKMESGGHFRVHKDDYQASYGFIYYLNLDWKWDWGGLLLTINKGLSANVYIPEFNKLLIMDHEHGLSPHSVTEVAKYAKEPRLMLVGFLK